MQTALQRQRRLVVQQPRHPILVAEDQFAGEENAVRVFLLDAFRQFRQLVDAVGPERETRGRGQPVGVAVIDIEGEGAIERCSQPVDLFGATVALRIDRLGADEDEVPEMVWKQALHPEHGVDAAAAARADHENRRRRIGIERGRILAFRTGRGTEYFVDFLFLLALHMDANRNLAAYLDTKNRKIDDFLGMPSWRERWTRLPGPKNFPRFLAEMYAEQMHTLLYLPVEFNKMKQVRSDVKNLPLYHLALFSRHARAYEYWDEVLKYSTPQLPLDLRD